MRFMGRLLFFAGCLALLVLSGCTVPSDYAEAVSFEIKRVDDAMKEVRLAFENEGFSKENEAYKNAVGVIAEARLKFENLGDFRGNDSLRLAALDYVVYCDVYFENSIESIDELIKAHNLTKEECIELESLTNAMFDEAALAYRSRVTEEYVKFMRKYELIGFDK